MKFWFRKHHYNVHPKIYVRNLVFQKPHFQSTQSFIGHEDDCCDYWQPVDLDDPATKRAFMLDDDFSLTPRKANK